MRKTSVYLSDEEAARLARLASLERTSQADIIRRAIREYVPHGASDREFVSIGVADGPGGSVADLSEDKLLKGFGER